MMMMLQCQHPETTHSMYLCHFQHDYLMAVLFTSTPICSAKTRSNVFSKENQVCFLKNVSIYLFLKGSLTTMYQATWNFITYILMTIMPILHTNLFLLPHTHKT